MLDRFHHKLAATVLNGNILKDNSSSISTTLPTFTTVPTTDPTTSDQQCSICLEHIQQNGNNQNFGLPEECAHVFCANCIIQCVQRLPVTRYSSPKLKCPVCRIETSRILIWPRLVKSTLEKKSILDLQAQCFLVDDDDYDEYEEEELVEEIRNDDQVPNHDRDPEEDTINRRENGTNEEQRQPIATENNAEPGMNNGFQAEGRAPRRRTRNHNNDRQRRRRGGDGQRAEMFIDSHTIQGMVDPLINLITSVLPQATATTFQSGSGFVPVIITSNANNNARSSNTQPHQQQPQQQQPQQLPPQQQQQQQPQPNNNNSSQNFSVNFDDSELD